MKVFREKFDDVNDINEFLEKNPQYKCFNIETITNSFGATNCFVAWLIKEERKETIDEEKLNKEALEYSDSRYGISDKHDLENAFKAGFKSGYRKAMEE